MNNNVKKPINMKAMSRSIIEGLNAPEQVVAPSKALEFFGKKTPAQEPAPTPAPVKDTRGSKWLVRYVDKATRKTATEYVDTKDQAEALVKKLNANGAVKVLTAVGPDGRIDVTAGGDGLKMMHESKEFSKSPEASKELQLVVDKLVKNKLVDGHQKISTKSTSASTKMYFPEGIEDNDLSLDDALMKLAESLGYDEDEYEGPEGLEDVLTFVKVTKSATFKLVFKYDGTDDYLKVRVTSTSKSGANESRKSRLAKSTEARNTHPSWANDIINAANTLKGLGKSASADWFSKEALLKKSSKELFEIRANALRMVSSATKDQKVKASMEPKISGSATPNVTMESMRNRLVARKEAKKSKAVKEGLQPKGFELSVCSLCGSSVFDAVESECRVCKSEYKKYKAIESSEFGDLDDNYTVIDIDGQDHVLIDDEGNTSVMLPDQLEGSLVEHSHDLVIEGEEEPRPISSGIAVDTEGEGVDEEAIDGALEDDGFDGDTEPEQTQVAFLKLPMSIDECVDLIQTDNQDMIEVLETDYGIEIVVNPTVEEEVDELTEEPVDEPELDDATEADDIDFDEEVEEPMDEPMDEPVEEAPVEDNVEQFVIALEEAAEGTILHIDGIDNVEALVETLNALLPEGTEIVDALESEEEELEEEELIDDMIEEPAEDEVFDEDDEDDEIVNESAKPKKVKKAKEVKESLVDRHITQNGTQAIIRNGKVSNFKVRTVYTESVLPKIIKKTKSAKKVVANKPSGDLTNTLESRRTSFMNRGLEVLGSGLNERKAIASLWSVLKSHKPEMDNELFQHSREPIQETSNC